MSQKGKFYFYNVMVFALYNTTLLWCIGARHTMKYTILMKKTLKFITHKFRPAITLKIIYFMRGQIFNQGFEVNESIKGVTF